MNIGGEGCSYSSDTPAEHIYFDKEPMMGAEYKAYVTFYNIESPRNNDTVTYDIAF